MGLRRGCVTRAQSRIPCGDLDVSTSGIGERTVVRGEAVDRVIEVHFAQGGTLKPVQWFFQTLGCKAILFGPRGELADQIAFRQSRPTQRQWV